MNSSFLESNNITRLITTVRSNVKQEIDYDITNESKYINVLKKLVKTIHKSNINTNVSTAEMNKLVITKCVPFLVAQIKKNNKNLLNVPPISTNNRPISTRSNDEGFNKANDFSNLQLGNIPELQQQAPSLGNPFNQSNSDQVQRQIPNFTNPGKNDHSGVEPPPRQMPNFRNPGENEHSSLEPPPRQMPTLEMQPQNNDNNNNNLSGLEPPPRQMPTLENQSQTNINMDISNLPPPMPTGNSTGFDNFDSVPNVTSNEDNFMKNLSGANSSDEIDPNDFVKKLEELQRDREYANRSDINQNQIQNNQTERDKELSQMNTSSNKLSSNYMSQEEYNIEESAYSSYENNSIQLGDENSMNAQGNIMNFQNSIRDKTRKVDGGENPGISTLVDTGDEKLKKDFSKTFADNTYLPTSYQFERSKRKIVCIDVSDNLQELSIDGESKKVIDNLSNSYWGRFKVNLQDKITIDKISDVFVESIIINNPAQANPYSNLYILIDIAEFNIKTMSNNERMIDKFILPNENTEAVGSTKIMKYHLKSNYVATINPCKLSTLTFNITNEDGDSVENTFTTSGTTTTSDYRTGFGAATDVAISDGDNPFRILDAVYNSSQQFIGNIHTTNNGGAGEDTIQFMKSTNVHLYNGETLFFPSGRTSNFLTANATNGDVSITVDDDPNTDFSVGDKVYLGNGIVLGKIASLNDTDPETITFEKAITKFVPSGAALYTSNPLPRVFASNDKSNRIILELVIMSR